MPCFSQKTARVAALLFLLFPIGLQGQIYRVYRPVADVSAYIEPKEPQPLHGWELSLSGVWSAGLLQDGSGWTVSESMPGARVRLLKEIFPSVSVGVEGQWLHALDYQDTYLNNLEKYAFGGVLKWVITPDARPQLYVLLSGGMVFNRVKFVQSIVGNFNQRSAVWGAGLGVQTSLGRRFALHAEYRASYEPSEWHNLLLQASSHVRHELSAGVSVLF